MEELIKDIIKLGLPYIHDFSHGFYYCIKPISYKIDNEFKNNLEFKINENSFLTISFYNIVLEQILRPDNLIGDFKKCFRIVENETKKCLGFIYW